MAVVRDVRVRHDPVVVADARGAAAFGRAAIDGDEFADGVAVADEEFAAFAAEFFVLRLGTDRSELEM